MGILNAENFYKVLGISVSADSVDTDLIRKQFKRFVVQVHPDKICSSSEGDKELSERAFKKLHQAYTVLSDPTLRRVYDRLGEDGESLIEHARNMFPGMDLEIACEIVRLVLGMPKSRSQRSTGKTTDYEELIRDQPVPRAMSIWVTFIFLISFYLVVGLV
jgi:DnaJ-class molecular chaperone